MLRKTKNTNVETPVVLLLYYIPTHFVGKIYFYPERYLLGSTFMCD
jgi:hypothetical protein